MNVGNEDPKERKGEDPEAPLDDEVVTERNPPLPPPNPLKPVPATPDSNPIDPRVGQPW